MHSLSKSGFSRIQEQKLFTPEGVGYSRLSEGYLIFTEIGGLKFVVGARGVEEELIGNTFSITS